MQSSNNVVVWASGGLGLKQGLYLLGGALLVESYKRKTYNLITRMVTSKIRTHIMYHDCREWTLSPAPFTTEKDTGPSVLEFHSSASEHPPAEDPCVDGLAK